MKALVNQFILQTELTENETAKTKLSCQHHRGIKIVSQNSMCVMLNF